MPNFRFFTEHPDNPYRLGRHQVHDALDAMPERDAACVLDLLKPIRSVVHQELQAVFDQGQLGSCTANAALGVLVTAPYGHAGVSYTEDDAVALYSLETKIDDSQIPGEYPPDDTGSSGPWSMLALEKQGKVRSFVHSRSVHHSLLLLNEGPISIGVPWYRSMFKPDSRSQITVDESSGVAGGHQVAIVANDATDRHVVIRNSWGPNWGSNGHAFLSWSDLETLFGQGGDTVQPRL